MKNEFPLIGGKRSKIGSLAQGRVVYSEAETRNMYEDLDATKSFLLKRAAMKQLGQTHAELVMALQHSLQNLSIGYPVWHALDRLVSKLSKENTQGRNVSSQRVMKLFAKRSSCQVNLKHLVCVGHETRDLEIV